MSTHPRPATRAAGLVVAAALAVGGCSGDDSGDRPDAGPGEPSASATPEPLATTARLGEVAGRLPKPRRQRVREQVVRTVDAWLDAAYLDADGAGWPGFTPGARREARRDRALTSNATLADGAGPVTATRRRVVVDVLAVGGRAAGSTARIDLVMRLGEHGGRAERVRGRVLLTPTPGGWRIFGYDLARGAVRDGGKGGGDRKDGGR